MEFEHEENVDMHWSMKNKEGNRPEIRVAMHKEIIHQG